MFTIRELLTLDSVRVGIPYVAAGERKLDAAVRWLHVGDISNVSHYLQGGEVLLTDGAGIGKLEQQRREVIRSLDEAGVAAIILELGVTFDSLPSGVAEECERSGIVLIVLARPVAYVDISHEVHSELVNRRVSILSRQVSLAELFTERILQGASVAELLELLSDQVGNPVLLVDHMGLIAASADRGIPENEILIARSGLGGVESMEVPLPGAKSEGWQLLVLALITKLTEQDLVAMTEAARSVSLLLTGASVLTDSSRRDPHIFILDLLDGESSAGMVALRATHLGFKGRYFIPFALSSAIDGIDGDTWHEFMQRFKREQKNLLATTAKVGLAFGVFGVESPTDRPGIMSMLRAQQKRLNSELAPDNYATVIVGGEHRTWKACATALQNVRQAVSHVADLKIQDYYDASKPDVQRLLKTITASPELREFARISLAPVIAHDSGKTTPLLPTLRAFCNNGGQKTVTARELYIERSSLYDRLGKLERLLSMSFTDTEKFFGLQLAVRVHDLTGTE